MFTIATPFMGAVQPAYAGVGISVVPDFPDPTTVGQMFTGRITIGNASTPPQSAQPITLTSITLAPGCSVNGAGENCAGGVDPGVFVLGTTGTGVAGTACAGTTFTITQVAPGLYNFVPTTPVMLAAGQTCAIDFPAQTAKVPTVDVNPAQPGVQTNVFASVRATSPVNPGNSFLATGFTTVTVNPAPTTIATVATPTGTVGSPVTDTAQVSGLVNPTGAGTVTFTLYSDPTCTTAVGTNTVPVAANGSATSNAVTPPNAGTYHWRATFNGDPNNAPSGPTACSDPAEQVVVNKATPTITTTATPANAVIGTTVNDTATVAGLVNPTPNGTVTFNLFSDAACTTSVFTSTNPVDPATGRATSGSFTITQAGTYHWVASYSGDANNNPAGPTACVDPAEQVVVARATPTIATVASPNNAPIGAPVTDTATVSGLVSPTATGTVTFQLFSDAACTVLVGTSTKPLVIGPGGTTGTATSDPVTIPGAGSFHWVATYSGDVNNSPAGPTACADPAEQVAVAKASPTIATVANPQAAVAGTQLRDTATVSGLVRPTAAGTVTFQLFSDPTCTTQVFTSTNPVDPATGIATSDPSPPVGPGTYHWVATYSGDANNNPAGPTPCADPAEQVVVTKASPNIATTATPPTANIGDQVRDTATVTGGFNPTGTVTFSLFSDPACTTQVFTSTNPLTPAGTATSDPFTVAGAGTYHWVATYSGDPNNNPAGPTACADPAEQLVVSKASPTIATTASPGVAVGGPAFDTATVTGGTNPTGTVTFQLFSDAACTTQVFTSTNPLDPATHTARSGTFTTVAPGTYHWVATYNGDPNNNPAGPTACADPAEQLVVGLASPTISTTASPAVPVGGQVTDTATVTGGTNPTGTVTFTLFSDAACTTQVFTTTSPLDPATHTATAGPFTTTAPGTLHWVARYNGDPNNSPAGPTACADPAEQVTVNKTAPQIATRASSAVNVGGTVTDVATVTGLVNPTPAGTVTFRLFSDAACTTQVFTSTNPLDPATGTATSGAFTTTAPGTLHWVASYSGDANNGAAGPTACADPAEQVVVGKAGPSIVTQASPNVPVGGQISDTATLSGGVAPTGTITFNLFGPGNTTCTGTPLATSTVPVNGNGNYTSTAFTTNAAGAYRWVAVYSGDPNNAQAGPTACADPLETTSGNPVTPTLVTQASAGLLGSQFSDTATLSNGFNPTGTIRFDLFGPNNDTCTGTPIFSSTKPVTGNGDVTSDPFVLPSPGSYHFVATYSGDPNNRPVGPTGCLDQNETIAVGLLPVSLSTQASGPVTVGGQISDTATIGNGTANLAPTGTVTFKLFGPDNANCSGTPIFTSVKPVTGSTVTSDPFTPSAPGNYQWVAVYSGDPNNAPATTPCNDPLEQVAVNGLPTIAVEKTAAPASLPVPGGTFTFNVKVTNTSPVAVTITTLTDSIYGDITKLPGSTCNTAIGTVLTPVGTPPATNTYSCAFQGVFRGPSGATQTDVVTVTGVDRRGNTVTAHDDATVTITPVPPTITTTKTAAPPSMPEPGGTFTFTYSVTNTGPEAVTVTSIVDDVYGDLNGRGTCKVPQPLDPGATYTCTFQGSFFGNGGAAQTDTITTTAVDKNGNTVTSKASATVTLTTVPPTIGIVKTPTPTSLPEPGGTFRFTVTVTNTSFKPVTITSLVDDVYGDLNGRGTCAIGAVLAPNGGTYTCSFPGDFRGRAGDAQTDTVTVVAVDRANNSVTAKASARVTLTPLPAITTTKTAAPGSLPEPGGTFTFTFSVTNTGPEAVTITSLVDDVYGDLNGRGTCAVGARLAPKATYTCNFTGSFIGNAGAAQTDTITTTARNDRGDTVTSRASANVTLTNVPPTIEIVKTPDPMSRPEPGGTFRFTVKVTNTSFEPVTITSLVDNIYGDLNGRGSCAVGVVLAPNGGSFSCAFDGDFRGRGGDSQTDTVTVVGVDNDNTSVTAKAQATVTLTPVATPVVFQPPPPVVVPPPVVRQVLVRTGADAVRQARLAGVFLLVGLTLVAATWKFGDGGPGLAPVPSGPGGGPGPGGGGFWFGDGNWFGGARLQPPRGPLGGLGLARPEPVDLDVDVDDEGDDDGGGTADDRWARPPAAPVPPSAFLEMVDRPVTAAAAATRLVEAPVPLEAAIAHPVVPEVVVPEVVVPTVVQVRATGGLDAAALDAANAGPVPPPPAPPAAGGRRKSRKFGGR